MWVRINGPGNNVSTKFLTWPSEFRAHSFISAGLRPHPLLRFSVHCSFLGWYLCIFFGLTFWLLFPVSECFPNVSRLSSAPHPQFCVCLCQISCDCMIMSLSLVSSRKNSVTCDLYQCTLLPLFTLWIINLWLYIVQVIVNILSQAWALLSVFM